MLAEEQLYQKKNLYVLVRKLHVSQQCVSDEGELHTGCTSKKTARRLKGVMIPLYSALVRLHFQYCVMSWAPPYKIDIDIKE